MQPLQGDAFRTAPDPARNKLEHANVMKHLEKHAANGINPFTTPIVIDAGASLSRSISSVDEMMTITKTEATH